MNFAIWLQRTAAKSPDSPAIFLGKDVFATYGEFQRRVAALAAALQASGVKPGDRVALFLKNTPEYMIAEYAAWHAGAAVVPINGKLHAKEAAWIVEDSGAKIVFSMGKLAKELAELVPEDCELIDVGGEEFSAMQRQAQTIDPVSRTADDLAWLFYTSGTTGKPKGVMITFRMLVGMSLCYLADVDHVVADDAALYAAPFSHGAGIYNMMHVLVGARHVFPPSGGFDEAEIFELSRHFGSVHMFAAPTMVKRMTQVAKATGQTGKGLRTVVYAGGPMYLADIIEAVDHFGSIFVQIYGQGECPMAITAMSRADVADRDHPRWRERLASVGRAQSIVEVMIGDKAGVELPRGTTGEIMVRGDTVMPGYWRNKAATQKTFTRQWLMTGDMGFMDADGYVTMQDRSKDMIISGGTNIYPREVEEVLMGHAGVLEASVIGRPDPEWGEDVIAFVVKNGKQAVSDADLDDLCLAQIARFKRPKAYIWVPELPKNNYGKVLKTELRRMLSEGL